MIKPKYGTDTDPGFAILGQTSPNEEALRYTLERFREKFPETGIVAEEGTVEEDIQIPPEDKVEFIQQIEQENHELHLELGLGLASGDRFLAKMALGMGTLFLRDTFPESNDADLLRDMLWEQAPAEREEIPVGMTRFFSDFPLRDALHEHAVGDSHIVVLQRKPNGVFLQLILYGSYPAIVRVADTDQSSPLVEEGFVFMIDHANQDHLGPLPVMEFLAWQHGLRHYPTIDDFARQVGGKVPRHAAPPVPPMDRDSER
jgi:hypothetical protein